MLSERRQDTNLRLGPNWQAHLPRLVAMAVSTIPELHKKKSTPQLAGQLALYRTRTPKWGGPNPTRQPHMPCRPTPPNKCSLGLVWAFGRGERMGPRKSFPQYMVNSVCICARHPVFTEAAAARQPLPGGCGGQLPIGRPICPVWLVVRPLFNLSTPAQGFIEHIHAPGYWGQGNQGAPPLGTQVN